MSRIRRKCLDPEPSDRSVAADVLVREEPEEEEDEEEDEGDRKEDANDGDEDDGYSEGPSGAESSAALDSCR